MAALAAAWRLWHGKGSAGVGDLLGKGRMDESGDFTKGAVEVGDPADGEVVVTKEDGCVEVQVTTPALPKSMVYARKIQVPLLRRSRQLCRRGTARSQLVYRDHGPFMGPMGSTWGTIGV